jgi:hypothetical protein
MEINTSDTVTFLRRRIAFHLLLLGATDESTHALIRVRDVTRLCDDQIGTHV